MPLMFGEALRSTIVRRGIAGTRILVRVANECGLQIRIPVIAHTKAVEREHAGFRLLF